MVKTLIFDFGDVFIDLNKDATVIEIQKFGTLMLSEKMLQVNANYETGKISTDDFLNYYKTQFPNTTKKQLREVWNAIILHFPEHRLQFIEQLSEEKKYQLILLSNTNELHIKKVIENMTIERYNRFKNCFEAFYLSHEIHFRKPNKDIYQFVLETHTLKASTCLFIDDKKENTETAKKLNLHTWNINPKTEDITNLFTKMNHLF